MIRVQALHDASYFDNLWYLKYYTHFRDCLCTILTAYSEHAPRYFVVVDHYYDFTHINRLVFIWHYVITRRAEYTEAWKNISISHKVVVSHSALGFERGDWRSIISYPCKLFLHYGSWEYFTRHQHNYDYLLLRKCPQLWKRKNGLTSKIMQRLKYMYQQI